MPDSLSLQMERAIASNDAAKATQVLDAGLDPNEEIALWLPLISAVVHKSTDVIRVLVAHGADIHQQLEPEVNSTPRETPLYAAVECAFFDPQTPDWSIVELLLELGGNPNDLAFSVREYADWHGPRFSQLFEEFIRTRGRP